MSPRSIILGFLGAAFIVLGGYYTNVAYQMQPFVGGLLPVMAFAPLVVWVLAINPLLRWLHVRPFRPGELATMALLVLVACSLPGRGLLNRFSRLTAMPVVHSQKHPGWQKQGVLGLVPPRMLANDSRPGPAIDAFLEGNPRRETAWLPPSDVPWAAWRGPMLTWVPMILLFALASICIAFIVHWQWTRHEQLRYPLAEFTACLLGGTDPDAPRPILRQRLFWYGLIAMAVLHTINGLGAWYEESFLRVPLVFDFSAIAKAWPDIQKGHGWWGVCWPKIWPTIIALCFFVSTEICLSVGVSQFLGLAASMLLVHWGVQLSHSYVDGGFWMWQRAGSSLAVAAFLLYIGRRYYGQVLRGALGLATDGGTPRSAVWAGRGLILSIAALTALLVGLGVNALLALALVVLVLVVYLVVARISAEFGLYLIQIQWVPIGVLAGLLGVRAIGPAPMAIMALVALMFCFQPQENLLAFLVNGLRIADRTKQVRVERTFWPVVVVFVVLLAVAIPFSLWVDYNVGAGTGWDARRTSSYTFETMVTHCQDLRASGEYDAVTASNSWRRLADISPSGLFLAAAGAGFAVVALFYFLRIRFTWWPLHPILFLLWNTNATADFFISFLVGFGLKKTLLGLGGHPLHEKAKGFMVGVIAGELLMALLWTAHAGVYRWVTGVDPQIYKVFMQ